MLLDLGYLPSDAVYLEHTQPVVNEIGELGDLPDLADHDVLVVLAVEDGTELADEVAGDLS